jgi:hypothetical protein
MSTRPAFTVVLLVARKAVRYVAVDEPPAIHTPRSTNETGFHSRTGWVTSHHV